jgi:8-oxo-dGTP diphosphatase
MLATELAAVPGWVMTKKINNAIASSPTIFFTFTGTTVLNRGSYGRRQCNPPRAGRGIPHRGPLEPTPMTLSGAPIPCVGGLATDERGRLLLVQRANEPGRGRWSVPGGRVNPGESDAQALIREMYEETGLRVTPGPLVGRVVRGDYAIADYRCTVVGGELRAGDDALDARWCSAADLAGLPLVDGLVAALTEWDALPA